MLRSIVLVALTLTNCSDDGSTAESHASGTSTGGTSIDPMPTGAPPSRQLVVPDEFVLCSQALHQALEQGSLLRSKARVTLGAGQYDVSDAQSLEEGGESLTAPFSIPLGIEHQLELAAPRSYMIAGEEAVMNRSDDVVVAPQWGQTPMPGYQTVRVFQYFVAEDDTPTAWKPFGRPSLGIAASDEDSADLLELDAVAAAFSLVAGFGGALAPCAGPGAGSVTDRILLEGSEIEFEVRKEILAGGTMLRAVGEIEGAAIDESSFWNLEYGVTSADGGFDQLPFYALRFPQTAEGECGLWVGWWAMEERKAAFFLDCSLNKVTREVGILAIERIAGDT